VNYNQLILFISNSRTIKKLKSRNHFLERRVAELEQNERMLRDETFNQRVKISNLREKLGIKEECDLIAGKLDYDEVSF
jgi:hypothetical protein